MTMTIQQWCGHRMTINNPDETVSIADLAQFVAFDPRSGEYEHASAYDALVDQYGKHEATDHTIDYYDGFFMRFADGSTLKYSHN